MGAPSQIFEVKLVGVTAENGKKLLFTACFVLILMALSSVLRRISRWAMEIRSPSAEFWTRQTIHLITATVLLIGIASIWFNDPARLATAAGLVTAGLAFALQRVITSVAAYFILLRGKSFHVGDRIVMGGVRGDVVALSFIQTTIMEMGQPAPVQNAGVQLYARISVHLGRNRAPHSL